MELRQLPRLRAYQFAQSGASQSLGSRGVGVFPEPQSSRASGRAQLATIGFSDVVECNGRLLRFCSAQRVRELQSDLSLHHCSRSRLERMKKSPEWQGSHFENPQPIVNDNWGAVATLSKRDLNVAPQSSPSTVSVEPSRFVCRCPPAVMIIPSGLSTDV